MAEPEGTNPPQAGSAAAPPDKTEAPISAAQFQKELDALRAEISASVKALSSQPSRDPSKFDDFFSRLNDFFSSGFFFILLGGGLLFFAWRGLTVGVHTSFSFVLVVLGIAVLLFGTGTQGMGRFDSTDPASAAAAGRYTIGIAGGAGILAIAIGYGMVRLGPQIQQVFELQTHYAWVKLVSDPKCPLDVNRYWAEFTSDGEPLAYKSQKGEIFVLLPYYYDEVHRVNVIGSGGKKTIDGEFKVKDERELGDNKRCAPNPKGHFDVVMSQLNDQEGSGFDFQRIAADPPAPILVTADDSAAGLLASQGLQTQIAHPDAKAVQDVPPPIPVAQ